MTTSKSVIKSIKEHINTEVKRGVNNILFELIEKTPVRSGFAQANWRVDIGKAPYNPLDEKLKDVTTAGVLQEASVANFNVNYSIDKGAAVIYNNTSYIVQLNEGLSKQAEAGYVDRIIYNNIT